MRNLTVYVCNHVYCFFIQKAYPLGSIEYFLIIPRHDRLVFEYVARKVQILEVHAQALEDHHAENYA